MFALPYFNVRRVKKITNHRMIDAAQADKDSNNK